MYRQLIDQTLLEPETIDGKIVFLAEDIDKSFFYNMNCNIPGSKNLVIVSIADLFSNQGYGK